VVTSKSRSALLATLTGVLLLSSCGDERSVSKFCSTAKHQQTRLQAKYQQQADSLGNTSDPLLGLIGGIGMLTGAQGDLVVYFERLSKVAPSEIQPEVEAVRDSFKAQAEATREMATNPLGSLASGFIGGLQSSGSIEVVDQYSRQNCGFGA
jgi:hypothetical protein